MSMLGLVQSLIGGNVSAALQVLQQDLAGLNIRQERLHTLAGCMLCMTPESLRRHVDWPGTKGHRNREQLLRDIQVRHSTVPRSLWYKLQRDGHKLKMSGREAWHAN